MTNNPEVSPAMTAEERVKPDAVILDVCCGSKMFWFDKTTEAVLFGDIRREEHVLCDGRQLSIAPDVELDFRDLPFEAESFRMVVFDPPHLDNVGPKGWQGLKYGKLSKDWREDLRKGFAECFRVLESGGLLIFKWNETRIKKGEVLALTPAKPLLGHTTGLNGKTHWYVFMKAGIQ